MTSSVGLYNSAYEHDACGVAMVVDIHGRRSREIVDHAITALLNLEHRGAAGAEPNSGDGAGIMIGIPDKFLRAVCSEREGFDLPEEGSYATGMAFLPQSSRDAAQACEAVEKIVEAEGLTVLGWRDVPIDESSLGALARDAMPTFRQLFIGGASGLSFLYGITNHLMAKEELKTGQTAWAQEVLEDGQSFRSILLQVEDHFYEKGIEEIDEFLLLIASTEELDTDILNQEGLPPEPLKSPTRGPVRRSPAVIRDWTTRLIPLKIIRYPHQEG